MKLCIDCKHLVPPAGIHDPVYRCAAKTAYFLNVEGVDMVTGERTLYAAHPCRTDEDLCGLEAKWFEPKEA